MERLARLVMHHRRIVSAVWLVLFIGGLFSVRPAQQPVVAGLLPAGSTR